mgnify:CR=1 FL=1
MHQYPLFYHEICWVNMKMQSQSGGCHTQTRRNLGIMIIPAIAGINCR